jgi:hypothetical protein
MKESFYVDFNSLEQEKKYRQELISVAEKYPYFSKELKETNIRKLSNINKDYIYEKVKKYYAEKLNLSFYDINISNFLEEVNWNKFNSNLEVQEYLDDIDWKYLKERVDVNKFIYSIKSNAYKNIVFMANNSVKMKMLFNRGSNFSYGETSRPNTFTITDMYKKLIRFLNIVYDKNVEIEQIKELYKLETPKNGSVYFNRLNVSSLYEGISYIKVNTKKDISIKFTSVIQFINVLDLKNMHNVSPQQKKIIKKFFMMELE